MSNPELDLHDVNANIKFGENTLRFTLDIVLKLKIRKCCRQTTLPKIDEIWPLATQTRSLQYQCTYQVW